MKTDKQFYKNTFGWGFILWLFGYILGMFLFFIVPVSMIGFVISPFAIFVTLWVLVKKIKSNSLHHYITIAIVWLIIAVVFDYIFLVKAFNPKDGYYKLDVYFYYTFTLISPIVVGWWKMKKTN